MKSKHSARLLAAAIFSMAAYSSAATLTWDTAPGTVGAGDSAITGGTGAWNTTGTLGNWTNDAGANNIAWVNNVTPDSAIFGGTAGTVTLTTVTANSLAFNDNAGYLLTGSTLTLGGATPTITANVDAAISSQISGGAGLIKAGTGTLTLTGANNYTDGTTINNGTLQIGDGTTNGTFGTGTYSLGAPGATLRYLRAADTTAPAWANVSGSGKFSVMTNRANSGSTNDWGQAALPALFTGTLRIERGRVYSSATPATSFGGATVIEVMDGGHLGVWNGGTVTQNLTLAGTGYGETGYEAALRTGTNTLSGTVTLSANATIGSSATATFTNVISGGAGAGLTIGTNSMAGTFVFTGANDYAGTTTIAKGILQIGNAGTTGTLGSGDVINNATLNIHRTGTYTISNAISGTGAINVRSNTASTITFGGSGTVTGSGLYIRNNNGAGANVVFNKTANSNAIATPFVYIGSERPGIYGSSTMLSLAASEQIADTSIVYLEGTRYGGYATFSLMGNNETIGGLIFNGPNVGGGAVQNNSATTASTLTINTVTGSSYSYVGNGAAVTQNGAAAVLNIVKNGTGTQALQFVRHTGTTAVNAGILRVQGGDMNSTATTLAGGTLDIQSSTFNAALGGSTGSLTITGGTNSNFGGTSGAKTYSVDTMILGNSTLTQTAGNSLSASSVHNIPAGSTLNTGNFAGSVKGLTGAGSVVLGTTTAANLTLADGNSQIFTGIVSGAGKLTKTGAGVQILTGANTYTGGTVVNGGILIGTSGTAIGSGALTVGSADNFIYAPTTPGSMNIGALDLTDCTIGTALGGTLGQSAINSSGVAYTQGDITVDIYGLPSGATAVGTHTLISAPSGGLTDINATNFVLGKVYNATNFTVDPNTFTFTDTEVTIDTVSAASLADAWWLGGFGGGPEWALSDGESTGNWASDAGGTTTSLVPGASTTVHFSATGAVDQTTMTLGANMGVAGIIVDDTAGITLSADGKLLTTGTGGLTVNSGAGAVTIAVPVSLGSAQTWANDSSNPLTVTGTILNNGFTFTGGGSGSGGSTISGVISGSGTLAKSGTGTLTLSAANTYTGASAVNGGTLVVANASALGSATSAVVTFADVTGAVLDTNGYSLTLGSISGGGGSGGNINFGSTTLTTGGINTSTTFSGALLGTSGSLVKNGTGTLTLGGSTSNTFTGTTTVNTGGLVLSKSGGATAIAGNLVIYADASHRGTVWATANNQLGGANTVVSGVRSPGLGTFALNGTTQTIAGINCATADGLMIANSALSSGTLPPNNSGTGTLVLAGSGTYSHSAYLWNAWTGSGTTALTLNMGVGGVQTLIGAQITYTGATTVNSGSLVLQDTTALASPITVNTGGTMTTSGVSSHGSSVLASLTLNGGTYTHATSAANAWRVWTNGGSNLTIGASGGTINVNNTNQTNNSVFFDSGIYGSGALSVNANNSANGIVFRTAVGSYSGALTINSGNVWVNGSAGLVLQNSDVTVAGTGTLRLDANWAGSVANGSVKSLNGTATVTLGGQTLTIGTNNGTGSFSGAIGGTGGIAKTGTGTQTLTSSNGYTGATTVSAGVLRIENATATGTTAGGVTVAAGAALQLANNITVGVEALTLNGTGVANDGALRNISGSNSYGGVITLGSAARINSDAGLTLTLGGNVTNGANLLTIGGAGNTIASGVIGNGAGGITMDGSGTLTLNGANTYTGATTITTGTLALGASASLASSAVTIASGAVFDVSATAAFTQATGKTLTGGRTSGSGNDVVGKLTTGGVVNVAGTGTVGTLTVSDNLSLTGGGNLQLDISSNTGSGNDKIVTAGSLSLAGTTSVTPNFTGTPDTVNPYTIISGASLAAGAPANLTSGLGLSRYSLAFDTTTTPGSVLMTVSGSGANRTWSGAAAAEWKADDALLNWNSDLAGFLNLDNVTFDDTNPDGTVTLNTAVIPASIIVGTAGAGVTAYTISGTGSITGGGTLTKTGTTTLTLSTANTFSGGTTLSQGGITLTTTTAAGTGPITVGDGGSGANALTLTANVASGTFANPITVANSGSGTVTLTQPSNFSTLSGTLTLNRATTINSSAGDRTGISGKITGTVGTLTFTGGRTTLDNLVANDFTGNVVIATGATVQTNNASGLPSTASVTINGTGKLQLVGPYPQAIDALIGGTAATTGVQNIIASPTTLTLGSNGGSGTFTGNIVNNTAVLSIIKTGAGTQTFAGANTYTGTTRITGGTLALTNSSALGGSTLIWDNEGGALDFGTLTAVTLGGLQGAQNLALTNTTPAGIALTVGGNSSSTTYSGVLSGGNGLTKNGTGTLTLSGASANTYAGLTTVNQGALSLAKTGGATAINGSLTFDNNLSPDVYGMLDNQFAAGAVISFITNAGDHGRFDLMGTTQTVAGIQTVGYTAQRGVIQNSETIPNGGSSTLVLNGSADFTYTGYLRSQTGILNLTKSGSGKQTLTGPQITHAGLTTVSGGTLILDGTSGWNSNIVNTATVEFAAPTATWTIGSAETFSGGGTFNKTGGFIVKLGNHVIQATGQINIQAGTLQNDGNSCNWTTTTADMNISGSAILDLFADAIYVDALTGSGSIQNGFGNATGQSGNAAYIEKLVVGTNNAGSAEFTGIIRDNATNTAPANGGAGGGVAIEKTGTGLQKLTGASVYTGATTVSAGTLQAGVASVANVSGAIGKNSPVTVANTAGAILDLNGFDTQIGSLTGGGTTGGTVAMGTATLTTGGANLSSPAPYAGVISGTGGLIKTGTGTQSLSGLNSYTGVTTINGGILSATIFNTGGTNGPLGAAPNVAANLVINGATLQYEGTTTTSSDREYTIGTLGGTLSATGTGAVTLTASPTLSGTDTARTITLTGTSTVSNTIAGVIANNGTGLTAITKTNTGTWQIGGTSANTYTGTTTVDNGTLILGKTAGVAAISGPVTMGAVNANQPNLRMAANNQFASGVVMTFVNASGNWTRFDLQGTLQTVAGLQCTTGGGIVQNEKIGGGGTTGPATITVDNSMDYTFNGYMRDRDAGVGVYLLNLVKTGVGSQTLTGTNIGFSGSITVNGGKLIGSGTGTCFGANLNTRTFTVNSTGTLEFQRGNTFGGHNTTNSPTLVINAGGTVTNAAPATNNALRNVELNGGTLTSTIGSPDVLDRGYETYCAWGINGTVTSTGNSTITTSAASNGQILLNSTGTNTTFNVISDTLTVSTPLMDGERGTLPAQYATSLTKTGAGTMLLASANTWTGATNVQNGTVQVTGSVSATTVLNLGNATDSGKVILGDSAAAVNQSVAGLATIGTGTTNAVVGGNAAVSTLTVNLATGTNTFAGSLGGVGTNENNLALTKSGAGTLVLSGVSTLAGNTAVNAGTVLLTGSLAGPATVGTTGTLAGNGTITGATTIANTGILSPGNGDVNALNFGSTLNLQAGSSFEATITGATTNDKVIVTGAMTVNGTIKVTLSGYVPVAGDSFDLADFSGTVAGTPVFDFSAATLTGILTWDTSTFATDGKIKVSGGDTYASWVDSFGLTGGDALAGADPDNDGIPNGVEMVLGGNPATGMDTALLPTIELVTNPVSVPAIPAGEYLLFTYRRTDESVAASVAAACETSTTLVAPWTIAVDTVSGVVIQTDDNYGSFVPPAVIDTDRVRVYVPLGANTELFGRLNVVVP